MKKQSKFRIFLDKVLRWFSVIDPLEISKKEMCERAQSVCYKNCATCAWHDTDAGDEKPN